MSRISERQNQSEYQQSVAASLPLLLCLVSVSSVSSVSYVSSESVSVSASVKGKKRGTRNQWKIPTCLLGVFV